MGRNKGLVFLSSNAGLPVPEDRHMRRLSREVPSLEWVRCDTREGFLNLLPECRVALVWRFKAEWLASAPRLRLVSTPAAGRDWMEIESGPDLAVRFGTFHGELMGETVVALMLAFVRGVKESLDRQAGEPWARREVTATMRPLRGSRAVILGFGHIGKWIGRLLKPFGVRITGVNRTDLSRPDYFGAEDAVVSLAGLDAILPSADHLVLALPGGADSNNVIDARRLALLRPEARVYNVGRGNAIDLDALAAALEAGTVAGAGLDVYDREPLAADAPIRRCPNVILMPHVSAFAPNYMDLYLDELLQTIGE